jgi:ribosomal protein S18 acetylase RimI-like enzyme
MANEQSIIALWELCDLTRSWNDPAKDIARKLTVQPELFIVAEVGEQIVGTVMAGYEGHRGWINYLAVHPNHQRRGIGRALMTEAAGKLQAMGCPKINLQVRHSNGKATAFYRALGYTEDDVVSLGKRLIVDD